MYDRASGLELTPEQFEIEVRNQLNATAGSLISFSTQHRELVKGVGGEFEIDVTARFEALGASFLVLIECKRYSSPVKRDVVLTLHTKLQAIGAQKGMIFTTSGFQKGAVEYATTHGIALVQLVDGKSTYQTRSMCGNVEPPADAKIPPVVGWLLGKAEKGNLTLTQVSKEMSGGLSSFLFDPELMTNK
ncbi:restriction endonuclease [Bacteriovorax stolpii]|uniref:restriction endonuclease n=1 Tax=Bacteriovorax stolpii TaxID=960 RepID=UPI001158F762|nr:restriction endonuclease [Bacteriovorax stolpii]QDK40575.1 restriction endonuclease [Bacteriovorax stolpii]